MALLEIENLTVEFVGRSGTLRAVDEATCNVPLRHVARGR